MSIVAVGPLPGSEQLFNRVAQLTIGLSPSPNAPVKSGTVVTALQITGLHMQFKVHKSVRIEPATCEISVYNMTAAHRAAVRQRGLPVILSAGYTNTVGEIFSGVVRYADNVRQGPDWVTKIQCGDGELSYRFARLSQSWGSGTAMRTVAVALINTLGPQANITAKTLATMTAQFPRGYHVSGPAALSLDRLLYGFGYEWHFSNGQIVVLQQGQTTGETAVLLSPSTGLVGSPEHGSPDPSKPANSTHTLKVKSLLIPTLKPAGLVQVQAEGIGATSPAFFRCQSVDFEGDTFGGPWTSSIECWPVQGS